jgi:hypothetical protein
MFGIEARKREFMLYVHLERITTQTTRFIGSRGRSFPSTGNISSRVFYSVWDSDKGIGLYCTNVLSECEFNSRELRGI